MNKRAGYLAIAVLTALAYVVIADDSNSEDSKLLCRDQQVELTKVSQVKSIAEALNSNPAVKCSKRIKKAILDILPMIGNEEDACSSSKFDKISKFHARYLSKRAKRRRNLPKSLRRFAIAYGLRVSRICKDSMADRIFQDKTRLDIVRFNEALGLRKDVSNKLTSIIGDTIDYDSPFLIVVLKASSRLKRKDKIHLSSKDAQAYKDLQRTCKNQLKPHYQQLIVPVTRLAGLGFNHKSSKLNGLSKDEQVELNSWYKVILICESILSVEVVESQSDILTIMTDDESSEPDKDAKFNKGAEYKLRSRQEVNLVADEIYDGLDKDFIHSIENIKLDMSKKELKHLVERLLKLLKNNLSTKKVKFDSSNNEAKSGILLRNKRSKADSEGGSDTDTKTESKPMTNADIRPFRDLIRHHLRKIATLPLILVPFYFVYASIEIVLFTIVVVIMAIVMYTIVAPLAHIFSCIANHMVH